MIESTQNFSPKGPAGFWLGEKSQQWQHNEKLCWSVSSSVEHSSITDAGLCSAATVFFEKRQLGHNLHGERTHKVVNLAEVQILWHAQEEVCEEVCRAKKKKTWVSMKTTDTLYSTSSYLLHLPWYGIVVLEWITEWCFWCATASVHHTIYYLAQATLMMHYGGLTCTALR